MSIINKDSVAEYRSFERAVSYVGAIEKRLNVIAGELKAMRDKASFGENLSVDDVSKLVKVQTAVSNLLVAIKK